MWDRERYKEVEVDLSIIHQSSIRNLKFFINSFWLAYDNVDKIVVVIGTDGYIWLPPSCSIPERRQHKAVEWSQRSQTDMLRTIRIFFDSSTIDWIIWTNRSDAEG